MSSSYYGKSISSGIAIGRITLFHKQKNQVYKRVVSDISSELNRFQTVLEQVKNDLTELYHKARLELGIENALIFEAQRMILEDTQFLTAVKDMIMSHQVNAEYAVKHTEEQIISVFETIEDSHTRARIADIKDVTGRLIDRLEGRRKERSPWKEQSILLAEELTPGELMSINSTMLQGLILLQGTENSHIAILARAKKLPTLIQVNKITELIELDAKSVILDGDKGILYLEPEQKLIEEYMRRRYRLELEEDEVEEVNKKHSTNRTQSGRRIEILANVSSLEETNYALSQEAGGIGLFRSEYMFLERSDYPTEEEQFEVYRLVAETMAGRRVILRTLDIGSDKMAEYFHLEEERNPALGYRAIRISLDRVKIFKTQLRAMYRAATYGNIAIMFPMIVSVEEVRRIKSIVQEVKAELKSEGVPYGDAILGIMIETPAAVIISDLLAMEVDFFSIGTNDLTQYTLAADRLSPKLSDLYNPHHPAILRMIRMVVENAHAKGIKVSICGELAADMTLTEEFISIGVDELSVSPRFIQPLRRKTV